MSKEIKRAVLITGGSGGIGLALAHVFARNGNNLVLVARNEERLDRIARELERTYTISCEWIALDLSRHGMADELYSRIKEREITVDILVNNAGFGTWGNYWNIDPKRSEQEMLLNMVTLALLTKYFASEMIGRGGGKILNVASTAAFQPGPLMAIYYATKSFVVSFSEALSKEFEGTGVTISALCPGPTETEFQQHAGIAKMHLFKKLFLMDAPTVAERAYEGLMRGKRIVITGLYNRIGTWLAQFLPRKLTLSIVLFLHKRRG